MIKLVIQIPCFNEEQVLPATLAALPREVPGVDAVEWLVVDDGSADRTAEVARAGGADHVVRLPTHQGLARAFMAGLEASLAAGADVIVNTDADNQYNAGDIPALVEPVLSGRAGMVVGARPVDEIEHFSPLKKFLSRVGNRVVGLASGVRVPDAPSGFRAISRETARQINVFSKYTYTLETIIQAGQKGMAVATVPVRTNPPARPSRLVRNVPEYVVKSLATILRIFVTYRPLRFFAAWGAVFFGAGFLLGLRFLHFYLTGRGQGHVQSVILAGLLMGGGFFLLVTALVVDLIAVNRQFLERIDWRVRNMEERLGGDQRHGGD